MSIGRILLLLAVITGVGVCSASTNVVTTNAPKAKRDGPALSIARLFRAPIKPEEQLIADLDSSKVSSVLDAMEKLQDHYRTSTNAHSAIKRLLADQRSEVRRRAARTIGVCRAVVDENDVRNICQLLLSRDSGEINDGLKSLRTLAAPQATPLILPLLQYSEINIIRDACRTLAEIGTREAIPAIQPLANHPNKHVKEDAVRALMHLRIKYATMSGPSPERVTKISTGTGFIVAEGGYILTCEHVVNGATSVKVRDTTGGLHLATIVSADPANDLCLLFAPTITNKPISVVEANSVVAGQTVYCLGYPLEGGEAKNLTPVVGNGVVASLRGLDGDTRHFQVTVAMNPGNSGGPVFDESGRWIGVAAHKLADLYSLRRSGQLPQGFNFAVKSTLAVTLFDALPSTRLYSTGAKADKMPLEDLVKRLSQSVVCVIAN